MKNFFLFIMLFPSLALAADKAPVLMEPLSIGSIIQVFAGLIAVLLLFGGIVFLLRRMGGFRTSQGAGMHIIESVSISTRDRVLLMQVGSKQVLIGVSPNGISPIKVFDETVIDTSREGEKGFAGHLRQQLEKRKSSGQKGEPS